MHSWLYPEDLRKRPKKEVLSREDPGVFFSLFMLMCEITLSQSVSYMSPTQELRSCSHRKERSSRKNKHTKIGRRRSMNFFENKQKKKLFKKPPHKKEDERKPEPLKRGRPNNKSLKYTKKQIANRSIKSKNRAE